MQFWTKQQQQKRGNLFVRIFFEEKKTHGPDIKRIKMNLFNNCYCGLTLAGSSALHSCLWPGVGEGFGKAEVKKMQVEMKAVH